MDQDTIKLNAGERRKIKAIAKVRIMMRLPLCAAAVAMYMLPAMLIGLMTGVSADANLERMALMFGLGIFCEVVLLTHHDGNAVFLRSRGTRAEYRAFDHPVAAVEFA